MGRKVNKSEKLSVGYENFEMIPATKTRLSQNLLYMRSCSTALKLKEPVIHARRPWVLFSAITVEMRATFQNLKFREKKWAGGNFSPM